MLKGKEPLRKLSLHICVKNIAFRNFILSALNICCVGPIKIIQRQIPNSFVFINIKLISRLNLKTNFNLTFDFQLFNISNRVRKNKIKFFIFGSSFFILNLVFIYNPYIFFVFILMFQRYIIIFDPTFMIFPLIFEVRWPIKKLNVSSYYL